MDSPSIIEPERESLRFIHHSEDEGQAAHLDGCGSITGSDIEEESGHTDIVHTSTQVEDNPGTEVGYGGSTNTMSLLNTGFVCDPEPLIYAGPRSLPLFPSRRAQPQALVPFVQQYHQKYNFTINYSHSFAPTTTSTRPAGLSFNIQDDCHPCPLSTSLDIHKVTAIDRGPLFNSQAQSSFNSPVPHSHTHSESRAPLGTYLCVARSPSPTLSRKTFHHLEKMTWSSSQPQNMFSTYVPDDELGHETMSAPNNSSYWQASLHPADGQEGVTPYLHLEQFDQAEAVLDMNNMDIDYAVVFDSMQDAMNWRSRKRVLDPQTSADPTIPRTTMQKKAVVKLLFKAFKSVVHATDNPQMKRAFEEQKHDNRLVETLCWTIVEGLIDRCDRGPLLNAFEAEKAKNNPSIRTFADRLNAVVETMSRQKTICKHVFDPPYLYRFLDDPFGSKQRVESNRKLNKKKGSVMNAGKKSLGMTGKKGRPAGGQRSTEDSEDEMDDLDSEYQEYPGGSSGISSAFGTPDQPNLTTPYSSTPPIKIDPVSVAHRYRVQDQATVSTGRRIRGASRLSASPLRTQTTHSPYGEQYGDTPGTDSNANFDFQSPSMGMSMMPGSIVDPALGSYTSNYTHGIPHPSSLGSPFQSPMVSIVSLFEPTPANLVT